MVKITFIYVYVEKENGVNVVKGVKRSIEEKGYLFKEEDQCLEKHPIIANAIKDTPIVNYRNFKLTGNVIYTYYDATQNVFVFNGSRLEIDKEESIKFTEDDYNAFNSSTPRNSFGSIQNANRSKTPGNASNEPTQPKIAKVSASEFDYVSVSEAIKASSSLCVQEFDVLKDDAKTWIGRLEHAIKAVGGDVDLHAFGVVSTFLDNDASEW